LISEWLFPKDLTQALASQKEMAERVLLEDPPFPQSIAGVDVSNTPFDPAQIIFGAVVLFDYPDLKVIDTAARSDVQKFPYIPGLLGFREAPTLVQVCNQLSRRPDLIFVDGHGISHPRGLGIASHLGVLLDIPTIGVAKSILVGKPAGPLGEEVGSTVPLVWKGKEIGILLRSRKRALPLIISPGHKITLPTALSYVQHCLKGYRLPEPTRQAHLAANRARLTLR
jgi:deoxyribonuclease V